MLICNKYLHSKSLSQVRARPTDSPFWMGRLKVKDGFFNRGTFSVINGESIGLWEDTWLGDMPLSNQYPSLYSILH